MAVLQFLPQAQATLISRQILLQPLRACEIEADALLKGTRVDGVYDSDPEKNPKAKKYDSLTFDKALADNLKVMDQTAFAMCKESDMPIIVFDVNTHGNLTKLLEGEKVGTTVTMK
jgi:uridylate kinase